MVEGSAATPARVLYASERQRIIVSNSRAKRNHLEGRTSPVHSRKAILRKAVSTIKHGQDRYAVLIAREDIKTIHEAQLDVARYTATLDLAAEEATRLSGETIALRVLIQRCTVQSRDPQHLALHVGRPRVK